MSQPPEVFLFRHGEALNNVQTHLIGGRADQAPLVEAGIEQSMRLGRILQHKGLIPDVVYSSSAVRARQTGEATLTAMGLQLEIVEDNRLHEQGTGDWTGCVAAEIFTDGMVQTIEASGKDFRPPNGESMNDVGDRMFDWLESLSSEYSTRPSTVFGFSHGGAIRSLASKLHEWNHAETYHTRPANTSVTSFIKENGLWRLGQLGLDASELETSKFTAAEINARLASNEVINKHLESVIWFGSVRNKQDVHAKSDCDLQIILNEPTYDLTLELNKILKDYPSVDLSVMYLKDIYDNKGDVIFHDGTKGIFFMYVLADAKVMYGRNVYAEAISKLSLEDSQPSILITAREYLSRLRVMPIKSPNDTFGFKKYSLKLFKDILAYDGTVALKDISKIDNVESYKKMLQRYKFSGTSQEALSKIVDYQHNFTQVEMAALLQEYEQIIDGLCNE